MYRREIVEGCTNIELDYRALMSERVLLASKILVWDGRRCIVDICIQDAVGFEGLDMSVVATLLKKTRYVIIVLEPIMLLYCNSSTPNTSSMHEIQIICTFYISSFHSTLSSSHCLQVPNQLLLTHCNFLFGESDGTGEGSTHINPNHCADVQEWVVGLGVVDVGNGGGEVIACDCVFVVLATDVDDFFEGSLHPNQPGVSQVARDVEEVLVGVGCTELVEVTGLVVVFSSLHPNQPGVLQVDVDDVVVVVDVLVDVLAPVVVVSSKQPHQPGVWHVWVRVLVDVEVGGADVAVWLLFPVTSFQRGQS
jgi:hypothetical protein